MIQVAMYHIALFILTGAFPLLFYVGAMLLDNFFFRYTKKTSLIKPVVRLVKMSVFMLSCHMSSFLHIRSRLWIVGGCNLLRKSCYLLLKPANTIKHVFSFKNLTGMSDDRVYCNIINK